MAAELQKVGVGAQLVVGDPGEFTVWVDDQKVADKQQGRFPDPNDVIDAVRAAIPNP